MDELVVLFFLVLLIAFLGYRIAFKYDIKIIHKYHYNNVVPSDIPIFCRLMGIGNFVIAFGILLMAISEMLSANQVLFWFGSVILFVGLIEEIVVIIKYNGSLFGRIRR